MVGVPHGNMASTSRAQGKPSLAGLWEMESTSVIQNKWCFKDKPFYSFSRGLLCITLSPSQVQPPPPFFKEIALVSQWLDKFRDRHLSQPRLAVVPRQHRHLPLPAAARQSRGQGSGARGLLDVGTGANAPGAHGAHALELLAGAPIAWGVVFWAAQTDPPLKVNHC